jgi:hypothetical protein
MEGTGGKGQSNGDKYTIKNSWIYVQYREATANKQHVTTTQTLQQWGMAASFQFTS